MAPSSVGEGVAFPGKLTASPTALSLPSDFQLLRKPRQHLVTARCYHDNILDPHAAQSWIVQSGLNRDYLSCFQRDLLKPRVLVNLQAQPMPGSMKETNPTPLPHFGRKSAFSEELLDRLVDRGAVNTGLD